MSKNRKKSSLIGKVSLLTLSTVTAFSLFSPTTFAADTISVKLLNYLGNRTSVQVTTSGNYKVQGQNVNERLAGKDRFEVAVNISKKGWPQNGSVDTVVLAYYFAFADALAAAPLAYYNDAPILLTHQDHLTDVTAAEIKRLNPKKVIIVGGPGSVSQKVLQQVDSIVPTVERIDGHDRFEVSRNIATKLPASNTAFVANGLNYPDALAIAPYAARHGYPILLTRPTSLPAITKDALKIRNPQRTYAVGGVASVSPTVYNQLPGRSRIDGENRWDVAANIIKTFNWLPDRTFVATGLSFADALTGSVLAAKLDAPLLLTSSSFLPSETSRVINDRGLVNFTVLGGTGSVPDKIMNSLPSYIPIQSDSNYYVKKEGNGLALYKGSQKIKSISGSLTLAPSQYSGSNVISIQGRNYLGTMEFNLDGGYVRPTNKNIPYNDYLKGVVPREMPATWNLEAVKAQAVAARTYSIDDIGKTVADGQSYQVYGGYYWHPNSDKAVVDTSGQVIRDSAGKLITALYSSSNGGMILSETNSWGTSGYPYFQTKADPYDLRASDNPFKEWKFTVNKTQINTTGLDLTHPEKWWSSVKESDSSIASTFKNGLQSFKSEETNDLYLSTRYDIRIVAFPNISFTTSFTDGQRIDGSVTVEYFLKDTSTGTFLKNSDGTIKKYTTVVSRRAYDIRSMFGTTNMRSPYIKQVKDNGSSYEIIGGGWGHGIGMSQYGANQMAKEGKNYKQILEFYYPGTQVK